MRTTGSLWFNASLLVARLVVGLIFVVASIDKIQAPGAFADAVRAFHLLPPDLVYPFAFVVPWLELLVGLYLVGGFMSRLAAVGSIVLLGAFTVALLTALFSGDTAHACGCFGSGAAANPLLAWLEGGDTIGWWDAIRDTLLIVLSAATLMLGPGTISVDGVLRRRSLPQ